MIHPLFPVGIPLEVYYGEIDYLRTNERKWSLLARLRAEHHSFWLGFDSYDGFHTILELETGVRKTFVLAQNQRAQFGIYLQGTMLNGYQNFYKEYYDQTQEYSYDIVDIVRVKGYSGGLNAGAGLHLQRKRFIMCGDISAGPRFNVPEKGFDWEFKPNFTIGFVF